MNKHLLSLAALALAVPAFNAAALEGDGTEANPFQISKPSDFADMALQATGSYYILTQDIDFAEEGNYTPPFNDGLVGNFHFDGNYHVVRNITSHVDYGSLFGMFDGSVKNLGIENIDAVSGTWGPSGAFAGYAGCTAPATISNCYATGVVGGFYAGGLVGGTKVGLTIEDCYSTVDATSPNGPAGGLVACINYIASGATDYVKVINSYASGSVIGAGQAGGIVGGNQQTAHDTSAPNSKEEVTLENVVVMCPVVKASVAGPYASISATFPIELTTTNCYVCDDTMINDLGVTDGKTAEDLVDFIATFDAFTKSQDGVAVLKWQLDDLSGISDIAIDEDADAPAVYYNLQGVEVANPENGIYIVRRGNKTSKEIIR